MIGNIKPIVLRIEQRAESNQYKKQNKGEKNKKEEAVEEKLDLLPEDNSLKNKADKITFSPDNVPHIVDIVI